MQSLRRLRALVEGDKIFKKIEFAGLPVHVDRPKGFVQKGVGQDGKSWSREYLVDYGFLPGTEGGDEEDVDVFLGPNQRALNAYWIEQFKGGVEGVFDEFKVFVGYDSPAEAVAEYDRHIPSHLRSEVWTVPMTLMRAMRGKKVIHTESVHARALAEEDPERSSSALYKHMVRAISTSLQGKGDSAKDAAKGAFKIANSQLKKNGMLGKGSAGRLTGKGANRSRKHSQEPGGKLARKNADYQRVKQTASQ